MKKEYILSEDEKKQKKQKIEENRIRKRQCTTKSSNSPEDHSSPVSPQSGSMSPNMSRPQARVLPRSKSEDPEDFLVDPGPSTSKIPRSSGPIFHQLLVQNEPPNVQPSYDYVDTSQQYQDR